MKLSLNGALTIGTLDGAKVEIREEVGSENFYLFGLTASEVSERISRGYDPWAIYRSDGLIRRVLDFISRGLGGAEREAFAPEVGILLDRGDHYMLLADFDSYTACQDRVSGTYGDEDAWIRMSILDVARTGPFSGDGTGQRVCP